MSLDLAEAADLLRRCVGNADGQDGDGLYDHGIRAASSEPLSQAEADSVHAAAEIDADVRVFLARLDAVSAPRLNVAGRSGR